MLEKMQKGVLWYGRTANNQIYGLTALRYVLLHLRLQILKI